MPDPNYYEMLEIAPDATADEVREAYRLLAMVWHPDRFPKDSKLWTHANEKMQQINEAYNALKNIPDSAPRPAVTSEPATSSPQASEPTQRKTATVDDPWERVKQQEQQRQDARQRAQEQQRRIEEEKLQEAEKKLREAEARHNVENEQRRAEADKLRVLMREAQRLDEIKHQRAEQGLCILCGKPLGRIDKLARRDRHKDCSEFVEAPTAI